MCPITAPHMHCCSPGVSDGAQDKARYSAFCSATPCPTSLSWAPIPLGTSGLLDRTAY